MDESNAAVIILNYGEYETTRKCLRNIDKTTEDPEIVIVDNESTRPEEFQDYDCHLIVNKKNRGFAGGCNDGIEKAIELGVDYVCFLNNDTVPKDGFLSPLISLLSDESVGAVGGVIYQGDSDRIWYSGGKWNPLYVRATHEHKPKMETTETEWITGCLFASRIEVLHEVGGFNEDYFLYLEDVDLSQRIRDSGYRLLITPESEIHHDVSGSLEEDNGPSPVRTYYMARNRLLFTKRHFKGIERIKSTVLTTALSGSWGARLLVNRQTPQVIGIACGITDGILGKTGKSPKYP